MHKNIVLIYLFFVHIYPFIPFVLKKMYNPSPFLSIHSAHGNKTVTSFSLFLLIYIIGINKGQCIMEFYNQTSQDTLKHLHSNSNIGLSKKEVEKRLKKYGTNTLPEPKKKGILSHFASQFADFMIIVLLVAAVVSFMVSMLQGEVDWVDPIIIFAIIFLNAILGVIQEYKAEKSLSALKQLSAPDAKVIRDKKEQRIPAKNLVVGDIILLEAGDFIPADARLCSATQLKTDESSLTGESLPIEKNADSIFPLSTPVGDRKNMVFSSTVITNGRGVGVVTATGVHTEIGSIAKMIVEDKAPATPLQKKLSQTGKILGIAALGICVMIFILGLFRHKPIFDMFLTSVSLAVAAIPEGLPSIVTIMLSIGVQRMAKKKAVVRKLPVVETLGNATVICSDKTGTLTQNKMTVTTFYDANGKGDFNRESGKYALTLGCLCNNATKKQADFGDPMELALLRAAEEQGIYQAKLYSMSKRIYELPFDSERKCMTTVYTSGSHFSGFMGREAFLSITKGAPDILLSKCAFYYKNGEVLPLTSTASKEILNYNTEMAQNALRVIAITCKCIPSLPKDSSLENNLIFIGLLGLVDPPRPEAREAVLTCKKAGITPVMITGDHALTACAIGKELGITSGTKEVITGATLDTLSEQELLDNIHKYRVYARVSPSHKVRIVKAYQKKGHVVAMTGDGINDAPALKIADIGCAMGKSGTDVAKNAADMILMDDNFSTIIAAIKEGRGIYDNIQKSIHFLLSSNIGELMTIFSAILLGLSIPLLPVQLLWINLITDSLPAISLGMEPPEKNIMKRSPTPKNKTLFSDGIGGQILLEGLMIGALALLAYVIGYHYFDNASLTLGRTLCFAVLSLSQLFHAFNMKSQKLSLRQCGIRNNPKLIGSFILCTFLLITVISVPLFANIFQVTPLTPPQWGTVFILSFLPIVIVELQKKCR